MAHEKGGNQKVKRGIARREARTTHSKLVHPNEEKRGKEGKGWGRMGEDGGGRGMSMREEKEEGKGGVCAPDAAR